MISPATKRGSLSEIEDIRLRDLPSVSRPVRRRLRWRVLQLVTKVLALAALVALPFIVFVRVSVYSYADRGLPTWVALAVGLVATVMIVAVYAMVISKKLTGKARTRAMAKRVALPLVLAYCSYGLWYLSSLNAKTGTVQSNYTSLHPVLRLALGTILLVDRDVVLTDVRRTEADYDTMGLPAQDESLHYEQRDGYVHAVDLRTIGRGETKNWLLERYFRSMGFRTLRHVGTADHLHITLRVRGGL